MVCICNKESAWWLQTVNSTFPGGGGGGCASMYGLTCTLIARHVRYEWSEVRRVHHLTFMHSIQRSNTIQIYIYIIIISDKGIMFSIAVICFVCPSVTNIYCNTGVGGVFLPISKAIAILSSEQLQGCSLLSLLFLHINLICITMSATTLSNERQSNTEQNPANNHWLLSF